MVRKSRRRVSPFRAQRSALSRKRVSPFRAQRSALSRKRVLPFRAQRSALGRKRISRKRVSRRRTNRRRIKFSAGGSGYYLERPEISDEELLYWTTELERFDDGEGMEQQQRLAMEQLIGIIENADDGEIKDARDLAEIKDKLLWRKYVIRPSYTRPINESINRNNKFIIKALKHLFGTPEKNKRRIADAEQLKNYDQLGPFFQQKLNNLLTR